MSAAQWFLNNIRLDLRRVPDITLSFRQMATSQLSFNIAQAFDQTPAFPFDTLITLDRVENGTTTHIFQGRTDPVNRSATPQSEGHDFFVADAWQQLEDTIYQEPWAVGNIEGGVLFPKAVLGLDAAGDPISTGAQIAEVISYAASVGVGLQAGVIAAGQTLWPEQVRNASCAEVIRQSLRFSPDHVAWIDHSTVPPTFNVTRKADMPVRSIPLDGTVRVNRLRYRRCDELMPLSVRLIYETAQNIDGAIYRDAVIDKWPADGPDGGPRVLQASVELAGMSMQFQKHPVQVRALPASQETAKDYLRAKFPKLADVPDAAFNVTAWTKTALPDPEEEEHEKTTINPQATRLPGTSLLDLPNELVRGSIADWMRVKVGKVHIEFTVEATGTADAAALKAISTLPAGMTITATNAVTKIYHGNSQWESGENVPTGIARAFYESITAAYEYEGTVPILEREAGAVRYHGACLQLPGSADGGIAAMKAVIHSVDIEISSGRTTIGFGPAPYLAPADILELQRNLRRRTATWWSKKERASNKLGVDDKPGSKGDTVAPYDLPETILDVPPAQAGVAGAFFTLIHQDGDTYLQGGTVTGGSGVDTAANIKVVDSSTGPTHAEGHHMWIEATGDGVTEDGVLLPGFDLSSASIGYGATVPANTLPTAAAATGKKCHVDLGVFTATSFSPSGSGNVEIHFCPGSYTVNRV